MAIEWESKRKELKYGRNRQVVDRFCDKCGQKESITVDNAKKIKNIVCRLCVPRPKYIKGQFVGCKRCKNLFWVQQSLLNRKKYCSKKCRLVMAKMITCLNCKKEFGSKVGAKFCDMKCRGEYQRTLNDRNCLICGITYRPSNKNQKYCSRFCRNQYLNRVDKYKKLRSIGIKKSWENGKLDYLRTILAERMKNGGGAKARRASGGIETKPEKIFRELLEERNIIYEKEKIVGNHSVDFVIGNFAIEVDGDYWHSLENQKIKDIANNSMLELNGYSVKRFWESEILKKDEKVLDFMEELSHGKFA